MCEILGVEIIKVNLVYLRGPGWFFDSFLFG